ncbi:MAG: glycosyltransferase family 39 protein [Anaerolineae bacterium]|nr:glycosyltransferase family 39 protein [Anaerolineae bacterium]
MNKTQRLTVETGCWLLIAVVALVLRLASLDAAPLSSHEAREAMASWRVVTGQGRPTADYSPLLFAANGFLFALCGASDRIARFWPALCGAVLVLAPYLLRKRLGRVGALAAGVYLTLSPTMLYASRQVDGTMIAALGVMAALCGLLGFLDTRERRWLILTVGALAVAVTASSSTWGLLVSLLLAGVGIALLERGGMTDDLRETLRSHLAWALPAGLLTGLACATGLWWNPAGLGATGDLFVEWIARFGLPQVLQPSPVLLLAAYEPLALLFGAGGALWSFWQDRRLGQFLGLWALLGVILLLMMPARQPLDVLWVALPLSLLLGITVEGLVGSIQRRGDWRLGWLYTAVMVILWAHLYLVLARYALWGLSTDLALAAMSLALFGLLVIVFIMTADVALTMQALAVSAMVALLLVTLSAAWRVAYVRPADPRELLSRDPTAPEIRDLGETLRELSWEETGMPMTLSFAFEASSDSVLAWYLRGFSAAHRIDPGGLSGAEVPSVLVTESAMAGGGEPSELPLGVSEERKVVGQDFVLRRSWSPQELRCTAGIPPNCQIPVRWWLFRDGLTQPTDERWAVLWLIE